MTPAFCTQTKLKILRIPVIDNGNKLIVNNDSIVIDSSWSIYRTSMHYMYDGYDRYSILHYIKDIINDLQMLNTLCDRATSCYILKNYSLYHIINPIERQTIQDLLLFTDSQALLHLCTTIKTLKKTYSSDSTICHLFESYLLSIGTTQTQLTKVQAAFSGLTSSDNV